MAHIIISNVTILTMNPARQIIEKGWISITNNLIDGIGSGNYQGPAPTVEHINGHKGVVMPGMISTHQHVVDSLVRGGLEVDRGLFDWLVNVYYAGTSAYTPEDCAIAAKLNVAEAISSGVTTITDNWGVNNGDDPVRVDECAQATIETYKTTGIRMMFARMFSDTFPEYWGPLVGALLQKVPGVVLNPATLVEPTEDALTRIEALMNQHHGSENGRISVCPGPILPQTVTPAGLAGSLALANQFDTIIALHHCESETDARMFREAGPGISCTDYLNCLGMLGPRLLGAHCVWLDDRDIRLFKAHDCKISHCPSSNMFLASGIAPVPKFLAAGITVGLGTDDTNTNSNVSIMAEMRHAALLQKGYLRDPGAMTAEKVLEMATIDGARAIGLDSQIGSLEVGKKADIVLFNTNRPWWYPRHHLPSVIVYQAHVDDVDTVLIDGQVILRDRALSFLPNADRHAFFQSAQAASEAIVQRAGLQPLANRGLAEHEQGLAAVSFPDYLLGKTLYSGQNTVVCSAIHEPTGAAVVLKYQKTEYPSLSEVLRYRHEFEVLRLLEGPYVARALTLERFGNRVALVTEDFGGMTLRESFRAEAPTLERFLRTAIELARALAFIHERGVVHKDINPTNALVDPRSGAIKLIDFGLSTMLSGESRDLKQPERIEGTFEYMSPEQTGRMNRTQDYRSDFYSLGATLYALAKGEPPFKSQDFLQLIHYHIAKEPDSLHDQLPWVPKPVSSIVDRLLAKSAEHRYQSARGLLHDLEECLAQLRERGRVMPFTLGTHDTSPRFAVVQTLYGRSEELSVLLQAFDRVARGRSELLLLGGYSGIGKSALVNEVHKPIAALRGYFIKGKYDQYNRDVPYSAVTQAFDEMVATILMEPPESIEKWRAEILAAVDASGRVVVDVVPSLALLIGAQPPLLPLPPAEARNRFNAVFHAFVRALAGPTHPLVLFLDDVQWADPSSLDLLESLLAGADTRGLFVIAAYRDNEVDASHPFMLAVQEIRRAAAIVNELKLGPLALPDVEDLVGASVRCDEARARPLAALLHQRTAGNPFFLVQLLRALHEDGLFSLDDDGRWTWDLPQILALGLTDDVVDLMASRLLRLPESTKSLLRLASCIGNQFDLGVLARASGLSLQQVAASLWPTLAEGLVLPITADHGVLHGAEPTTDLSASTKDVQQVLDDRVERAVKDGDLRVVYRFLHDRVQQAAYALIPVHERKAEHLQLGRLLLGDGTVPPPIDQIFDIVSHLNLGIDLVTDPEERVRIARLNHRAGHRARAATAYRAAVSHYTTAMELLGPAMWSLDYRLALDLHRERAECEYIIGNFSRSDELAATAIARSETPLDKAGIYSMRVQLYMSEGASFSKATELAVEALGLLGYTIPATEDERTRAVEGELAKLERLLAGREIPTLEGHFAMTDPAKRAAMDLFMVGWSAAYLAQEQTVSSLMAYLMVTTSLEHGHTTVTPFGYVIYGLMLGLEGDYPRGYQFGQLAMRLNEIYPDAGITVRAGNIFAHALNPYFNPLETNLEYYKTTYKVAPQVGEVLYVVWAVLFMMYTRTMKGDPLPDVFEDSTKYLGFVIQSKNRDIIGAYLMQRQLVRALQGLTRERDSYDEDGVFSEAQGLAEYEKNQFHSGKLWYGAFRTGVHVIFNEYRAALESAAATEEVIPFDIGMVVTTDHHFYQSLALAALYAESNEPERARSMELLGRNLAKLEGWAATAPMNFAHRRDLVAAEVARCRGAADEAARLYDLAIDGAQAQGATHDEALAAETAAYFYLARGSERIARLYMHDAGYCYMRWGADGKVADLKERHARLLPSEGRLGPAARTEHSTGHSAATLAATVDLGSMMKAAQAISGEIAKQSLVDQLMRITIENAGARRGWLTLDEAKGITVIASVSIDSQEPVRLESTPLELAPDLSPTIVRYVVKTREPLVLDDATHHGPFQSDPRLRERRCKSIVAVPLLRQGRLTGVLYLENELVEGAFTPERVEVLKLLAAQAAVSLENARLYEELEARVAERTGALAEANRSLQESLDQLHSAQRQLSDASHRAGMAEVATSVLHNIGNVLNSVNVSCRLLMDSNRRSRSSGLAKAAALISEQRDLAAFFTSDERGRRLPEYLSKLAEVIGAEQAANITTLQSLEKNIDHINAIVGMQQQHAKFGGVTESLSLAELMEDAIRFNSAASGNQAFEVIREFDALPVVEADRHKIFQIVMNLLSNARHAVKHAEGDRRRIIVRIKREADGWVAIEIEDLGSGIAQESLTKIFNLGVTTKKDGHGFGLHSSSCNAIEMGGTLTAHSDGPGRGALFKLRLPLLLGPHNAP